MLAHKLGRILDAADRVVAKLSRAVFDPEEQDAAGGIRERHDAAQDVGGRREVPLECRRLSLVPLE